MPERQRSRMEKARYRRQTDQGILRLKELLGVTTFRYSSLSTISVRLASLFLFPGLTAKIIAGNAFRQEVHQQDLNGYQRNRQTGHDRCAGHDDFSQVAGQQTAERFADIADDGSPFFYAIHDRAEMIFIQDHVRGLLRHFSARPSHGDAGIGLLDGRSIVHPVPGHSHNMSAFLQCGDDPKFMLRCDTGKDGLCS